MLEGNLTKRRRAVRSIKKNERYVPVLEGKKHKKNNNETR